jgi:hypothetical protein
VVDKVRRVSGHVYMCGRWIASVNLLEIEMVLMEWLFVYFSVYFKLTISSEIISIFATNYDEVPTSDLRSVKIKDYAKLKLSASLLITQN